VLNLIICKLGILYDISRGFFLRKNEAVTFYVCRVRLSLFSGNIRT